MTHLTPYQKTLLVGFRWAEEQRRLDQVQECYDTVRFVAYFFIIGLTIGLITAQVLP